MHDGTAGGLGEHGVEVAKLFLKLAKLAAVGDGCCVVCDEGELRLFVSELGFEDLPGAGDSVALIVEKAFDAEGHLDVAAAIETLAGAAFVRFKLGKLAFPETKDIGRDVAEFGDFADAEVELVRDVGPGGVGVFADWLVLGHAKRLRYDCAGVVMCDPA